MKRLLAFIIGSLMISSVAQAEYYVIPDYAWTFTTITVNATPKTITFTRTAGLAIQAVGNDVYVKKNDTATTNDFKIANGSTVDFESFTFKKNEYLTIRALNSTIATVNYSFKQ